MPRAMRPCPVVGCPELTTGGRCAEHRRAAELARGSRQARGYDAGHVRLRARLLLTVDGTHCPRCGQRMMRDQDLDLDHTDDRTGYLGLAHRACNRSAGGKAAHR